MYTFSPVFDTKKAVTAIVTTFLCLLLSVYGPMASITSAQSSIDAAFNTLKQDVTSEISRRVSAYQKTIQSLSVDVSVNKSGVTRTVSSDQGSKTTTVGKEGASVTKERADGSGYVTTLDSDGFGVTVNLPTDMKDTAKQQLQSSIDELNILRDDANKLVSSIGSTAFQKLKEIAKNVIEQLKATVVAQVQAAVTQLVSTVKGVVDNLKSVATDLKAQIAVLTECADGVADGSITAQSSISVANGATVSCGDFNLDQKDITSQVQSRFDNVSTVLSTMSSVLSSLVSTTMGLMSQFTSLLSGVGGIGALSSLLGGDIQSLSGISGSLDGLKSSFGGIMSQLGTLGDMSGGATSLLSSLSGLINR